MSYSCSKLQGIIKLNPNPKAQQKVVSMPDLNNRLMVRFNRLFASLIMKRFAD